MDIEQFKEEALRLQKSNQAFLKKLKAKPPRDLDRLFEDEHALVFEKTDCVQCANCCKTTSPIFYDRDIERAAKALRLKPGAFADRYLRVDEDGDQVLKSAPCPFLDQENYCSIYHDRPAACREYPHTNRKRIHQILELTSRNTQVCPAVLQIVNSLRVKLS